MNPNYSGNFGMPMQQPMYNQMQPPYQPSFQGPMTMPGSRNQTMMPPGLMGPQGNFQQGQSQEMFTRRGSIDAAQMAVAETIKAKKDFPFMSRCTLLNLCMDIYENIVNTSTGRNWAV